MSSDDFNKHEEMQGTWIKSVSKVERWKAFIIRVSLGCILAICSGLIFINKSEPVSVEFIIPLALFWCGIYYGKKAGDVVFKREYSHHWITLTHYERLRESWKPLTLGFLLVILVGGVNVSLGRLGEELWLLIPSLLLIFYGLWVQLRIKIKVRTPEAAKAYSYFESHVESICDRKEKPTLPLFAYKYMDAFDDLCKFIINTLGRFLFILLSMALFGGFSWLLYYSVSSLPISIAIIIGALIIAAAVKR